MSDLCVIVSHGWIMFEITVFLDKECLPPFPILHKFYPWIHKCPVLFSQQFLNMSFLSLIFECFTVTANKDHTTYQKQFLKCVVWCCVVTVEKVGGYVCDWIDIKRLSKMSMMQFLHNFMRNVRKKFAQHIILLLKNLGAYCMALYMCARKHGIEKLVLWYASAGTVEKYWDSMQLSLICAYRIGPKYLHWKLVFHRVSNFLSLKFAGTADFFLD